MGVVIDVGVGVGVAVGSFMPLLTLVLTFSRLNRLSRTADSRDGPFELLSFVHVGAGRER